ncbi:hypothetical protein U9M48_000255 [Paspalum notatum var. saurae]|uniref:Expansin-like EG45 domain-containing protein n=1 Tax=Paspalum notatum var. saurae TaxID=547442 RepID=A0AAQ3SHB7_PASNO
MALLVAGTDGAVKEEQHGFAIWTATAGGTDGEGACGYGGHPAETIPFSGLVAGLGADHGDCGVCYRVSTALHVPSSICPYHRIAARGTVICHHNDDGFRVTVTDMCRGAACAHARGNLFELTNDDFVRMAKPGRGDELRAAGLVSVRYQWEDCAYSPLPPSGLNFPAFRVVPGSTDKDFAVTVVCIEGMAAGKEVMVQIKNKGEADWHLMTWTGGATWKYTSRNTSLTPLPVTAPISMKVTEPCSALTARRRSRRSASELDDDDIIFCKVK